MAWRIGSRLALLTGLLLLAAGPAQGRDLVVGYNQAWLEGAYGHDLTDRFDAAAWRRILTRTREGGGCAVRVWLLEGSAKEGVRWRGHEPLGLEPAFLANLRTLVDLAHEERVRLYWTLLSANWPAHWPKGTLESERQYNVFNDKYGHGTLFRERVLGPILDVIAERPRATFALDLMNEVQGSVRTWFWSDGWTGARRFMRTTAAFAHRRCPWLKVTVSSGHHTAADDVLAGRFDGLGLDFYDVHVYTDDGRIPQGAALARHARRQGAPIVVGEFGQASEQVDDALQARVTRGILADARRLGFTAAFAWRLEDRQEGGRRFSFYDGDRAPPALDVMRAYGDPQPPPWATMQGLRARGAGRGLVGGLER